MVETIEQYQIIKQSIPELLDVSGYRNDYVAKKIGMTPSYFSVKKQRGNWSDEDLMKILQVLTTKNNEVEDYLDIAMMKKKMAEGKFISSDEFEKKMSW